MSLFSSSSFLFFVSVRPSLLGTLSQSPIFVVSYSYFHGGLAAFLSLFLPSSNVTVGTFTFFFGAMPQNAVSHTVITNKEHRCQKYETANCAWFSHQEESSQVQYDEHSVVVNKCWIQWLRHQKNRYQPLQAIHSEISGRRLAVVFSAALLWATFFHYKRKYTSQDAQWKEIGALWNNGPTSRAGLFKMAKTGVVFERDFAHYFDIWFGIVVRNDDIKRKIQIKL